MGVYTQWLGEWGYGLEQKPDNTALSYLTTYSILSFLCVLPSLIVVDVVRCFFFNCC